MATQSTQQKKCFCSLLVILFITFVIADEDVYYVYNAPSNNADKAQFALNLMSRVKRGYSSLPLPVHVTFDTTTTTTKPFKPDILEENKSKNTKKASVLDIKDDSHVLADSGKSKTGGNYKKDPILVGHANPHDAENVTIHSSNFGDGHQGNIGATNVNTSTNVTTNTTTQTTTMPPIPSTTTVKASGPVLTNISAVLPEDGGIQISKFYDDEISNETLRQNNITKKQTDHHLYYNSSFIDNPDVGKQYWVNLDAHQDVKINDMLSTSHRRAATVKLSFDFPFYGHGIRNVTIATGGFLYTGDYVHSWLAATQYIAPLMANFDTRLSNNSFVKYLDNGTAFTVQWERVILQDKPHSGEFTFQCTLHSNGDIVFVYKNVALLEDIEDRMHPVKVGLSDAYIIDKTIFFVRRKTIYEYHRVQFKREDIKNWTVIVLHALDTCLDMTDCHSCLTQVIGFQCNWCGGRCSNGMDRHRQDWIMKGCDLKDRKTVEECHESEYTINEPQATRSALVHTADDGSTQGEDVNVSIAGVFGILFLVSSILGTSVWVLYAYRNPHTPSGQFLIRYRPSQWSWRRGEARYTAATIHM